MSIIVMSGSDGNAWITKNLTDRVPFCAGKLGRTECILAAMVHQGRVDDIPPSFKESQLEYTAGVYPTSRTSLVEYSGLLISSLKEVDALSPWNMGKGVGEELFVPSRCGHNTSYFQLEFLDPLHFVTNPWSRALEGRRILIVSPFKKTLEYNIQNRHNWDRTNILPKNFEHIIVKSRFSVTMDPDRGYDSWMSEYERLKAEIHTQRDNFDVALIGCGCLGLPLAAHIRSCLEKTAIHTGGATQLIFGVLGKRWETRQYVMGVHHNDQWVYPFADDLPTRYKESARHHYDEPTYFGD